MYLAEQAEASRPGSREKAWTTTLERVIEDLDLLNRDTEQYFLKIGGKLSDFIDRVNQISSDLAELGNLISGEQGLHASHALNSALDRARKMGANSPAGDGILGGLRQGTDCLRRTLTGFKATVSTFRTLGVLTRIEAARLGTDGSEFGILADDVRTLTANVQARVANALDTVALLIPPIENALQNARDMPGVISKLAETVSLFRDVQNGVQTSAVRLGKQYAAISDGFKRLIVSIQFHDITRQQIEHVTDVLRRLCTEAKSDTASSDSRKIAAIVGLQSLQLADAAEKFAASVASIAHGLDEVAAHVTEMVAESRTLSGLSADEQDSVFLKMEHGCTAILSSVGFCTDAEDANRAASGNLVGAIDRMRGPIEEIQAIEAQMKRMGMNARIQAAQTGAAGDVLGALATSIQQLAVESSQRSESLIKVLASMSEAALGLSKDDQPGQVSPSKPEVGYLEEMRTAIAQMHSSSERSFAQISQVLACGGRLRDDLFSTRESFSVGALFANTASRSQAMLKEIAGAKGNHDSAAFRLEMADYVRHYTMQSEHDVHLGLTKVVVGATRSAHSKAEKLPPPKTKEVEDNVEFF